MHRPRSSSPVTGSCLEHFSRNLSRCRSIGTISTRLYCLRIIPPIPKKWTAWTTVVRSRAIDFDRSNGFCAGLPSIEVRDLTIRGKIEVDIVVENNIVVVVGWDVAVLVTRTRDGEVDDHMEPFGGGVYDLGYGVGENPGAWRNGDLARVVLLTSGSQSLSSQRIDRRKDVESIWPTDGSIANCKDNRER